MMCPNCNGEDIYINGEDEDQGENYTTCYIYYVCQECDCEWTVEKIHSERTTITKKGKNEEDE